MTLWTLPDSIHHGRVWADLYGSEDQSGYIDYLGPRSVSKRAALLLVDFYRGSGTTFPSTSTPGLSVQYRQAVGTASRIRAYCSEVLGLPTFYTTNEARPEARLVNITQRDHGPEFDAEAAFTIVDALRPSPSDSVIYKSRPSAFFGTVLDAVLREKGVDSIIVAGQTTSGCVRATVVDAFSLGFDCLLVEDAIYDRSYVSHAANLFDMHHKYGSVLSEAELMDIA